MNSIYPRNERIIRCLLCGSDSSMHVHFETHQGEAGEDRYLICKRCGLVFQSPRLSENDLNAFYASQYRLLIQGSEEPIEKDLRIQHARAQHLLDFVHNRISSISSCLDIGSSTGILLEKFKEAYGCDVLGIEPGDAYRKFSQSHDIPALDSLETLERERNSTFDLIIMAHTLEHLDDPVSTLMNLRERWLSPKGFLLVEVPNLFGHESLELAHLTAFTPTALKSTIVKSGFEILKIRTHGKPRSLLIPLYITALAMDRGNGSPDLGIQSSSRGVKLRRKFGMFWNQITTRYAARWAWLPWPEVDER